MELAARETSAAVWSWSARRSRSAIIRFALGDVPGNAKRADDLPILVAERLFANGTPYLATIGQRSSCFFIHQRLSRFYDHLFIRKSRSGIFLCHKIKVCFADCLRGVVQIVLFGPSLVDSDETASASLK